MTLEEWVKEQNRKYGKNVKREEETKKDFAYWTDKHFW